jgi:hypothetical protein
MLGRTQRYRRDADSSQKRHGGDELTLPPPRTSHDSVRQQRKNRLVFNLNQQQH